MMIYTTYNSIRSEHAQAELLLLLKRVKLEAAR